MKKTRSVAAMLLAVLLLVSAVSCSSPSDKQESEETSKPQETEIIPETEETKLEPVLPDKTYNGADVNVLSRTATIVGYIPYEISAEEMNGEALNDAVYERNLKIEEQFDIAIHDTSSSTPSNEIKILIHSQDDTYNFFTDTLALLGDMLLQKSLYDLESIPYIDLEKPWWNKSAMSDLALFNKIYLGMSDILVNDKQRAYITIVSKDLMSAYNMEVPYELARSGLWTLDAMKSMGETAIRDLDGNGIMDENDQFGICTEHYAGISLFISSGCRLTDLDEEGEPIDVMYNEHNVNVMDKVMAILKDTNLTGMAENLKDPNGGVYYRVGIDLMERNQTMFVIGMVSWVQDIIANSDAYPAVLPLPKYDENQEKYHTLLQHTHANIISIPAILSDEKLELTGVVLEAMSAYSHEHVLPEYINRIVKSRYAVDVDTVEMLDVVFSSVTHDFGVIYNWGNMVSILNTDLFNKNSDGFASAYAAKEKVIRKNIESTVNKLKG